MLGPFDALIFDQDGTLLDAEQAHCDSWCAVASSRHIKFSAEIFASFAGKGDVAIARYLAAERPQIADELVQLKRAEYAQHLSAITLIEGAVQVLERAKQRGFRLAMATISPGRETLQVVRERGLDQYLDVIVHRESQMPGEGNRPVREKPEPDIYLAAAALLGVRPELCCAFEDSLTGLSAAKEAGMAVVVKPTEFSRAFDFSRADRIVDQWHAVSFTDARHVRCDTRLQVSPSVGSSE